ncbi:MAG: hypothetical protein JWO93_1601 [Micrococcaceae bacterium]|nr:hypothetical protein [Micrococcaceae bacterium]
MRAPVGRFTRFFVASWFQVVLLLAIAATFFLEPAWTARQWVAFVAATGSAIVGAAVRIRHRGIPLEVLAPPKPRSRHFFTKVTAAAVLIIAALVFVGQPLGFVRALPGLLGIGVAMIVCAFVCTEFVQRSKEREH